MKPDTHCILCEEDAAVRVRRTIRDVNLNIIVLFTDLECDRPGVQLQLVGAGQHA